VELDSALGIVGIFNVGFSSVGTENAGTIIPDLSSWCDGSGGGCRGEAGAYAVRGRGESEGSATDTGGSLDSESSLDSGLIVCDCVVTKRCSATCGCKLGEHLSIISSFGTKFSTVTGTITLSFGLVSNKPSRFTVSFPGIGISSKAFGRGPELGGSTLLSVKTDNEKKLSSNFGFISGIFIFTSSSLTGGDEGGG